MLSEKEVAISASAFFKRLSDDMIEDDLMIHRRTKSFAMLPLNAIEGELRMTVYEVSGGLSTSPTSWQMRLGHE